MEEHKIARIFGIIELLIALLLAVSIFISLFLIYIFLNIPKVSLAEFGFSLPYLIINTLIAIPLCIYNASIGIKLIRLTKHSYITLQLISLVMIFYLIAQISLKYLFSIETFFSSILTIFIGVIYYIITIIYVEQRKKKALKIRK